MKTLVTSLLVAIFFSANAQNETTNIIPNGGFELTSAKPKGWYLKGNDFSKVCKFWTSPTMASPDWYGPGVDVPKKWRQKGFGQVKPYQGAAYVGITVYGCEQGKPHCREYIQIPLNEPLVPKQSYEITLWVNHLSGSLNPGHLGIYFGGKIMDPGSDTTLRIRESVLFSLPLFGNNQWKKLRYRYTAEKKAEYLTIGNFAEDRRSYAEEGPNHRLPFAYIYIDEVSMRKLPPILAVPTDKNSLVFKELSAGKSVRLQNLYFDLDKSEFLPRSFSELNTLYQILHGRPSMEIILIGHTDNIGSPKYNEKLSLTRAEAVYNYLVSRGIDKKRLAFQGKGASQPMGDNDTPEGRRMNRRVEFLVIRE